MIDKYKIEEAKNSLGERAAEIIARGLNLNKWDSRNLKGCCPIHNEKTPSFTWNKKKNYFKCFGCGETMDILDYYTSYENLSFIEAVEKLFSEVNMFYDFEADKQKNVKKEYVYPKEEKTDTRAKVEEYLKLRGISKETLDYAEIKQDAKGNIVFEYKDQYGKLLLVKYRPSRKVNKGENKLWCQQGADTSPILYGMDKINPTKPLLICEGEIDRLATIEAGFKNVVSVPFGAGNYTWIEHNFEWLEQFEKIIIWSDNDEAGDNMRKEVIPRLGEWRCSYVLSPYNDINIHLYKEGKESVLKAIENAREIPIKDVVDMADVEEFDITRAEKISSGLRSLDKYISGFILGTVDIITGYNSSGKSTLVNQMCVCEPLSEGYKTFIFSGELPKAVLRNWIEYPMAGPDYIHDFDNGPYQPKGYYVTKETKAKMREWYKGNIFFYDNEEDCTAKSILNKMKEMARKYGVKNFVIDNIMTIDLECNEIEKNTKQKEFIRNCKSFAKTYNAVVHVIAHPRKTQNMDRLTKMDIAGSGDITNLADYVISVHRITDKEKEPEINKKGDVVKEGCPFDALIDLFKNRYLPYQDKTIGLKFNIPSRRFYGDNDNLHKDYGWIKEETIQQLDIKPIDCPF